MGHDKKISREEWGQYTSPWEKRASFHFIQAFLGIYYMHKMNIARNFFFVGKVNFRGVPSTNMLKNVSWPNCDKFFRIW